MNQTEKEVNWARNVLYSYAPPAARSRAAGILARHPEALAPERNLIHQATAGRGVNPTRLGQATYILGEVSRSSRTPAYHPARLRAQGIAMRPQTKRIEFKEPERLGKALQAGKPAQMKRPTARATFQYFARPRVRRR
ncbi:MAG: hypothetical protein JXB14_02370 [Candidatus Altiarchaeota archaeon]|nr:hypothetical protein [Candidatus Altiarchaeota archaeon]